MSRHISKAPITTGSQFGGVDNIIQPPSHQPTADEMCTLIKATNPAAGFPAGMNLETEPIPITKRISS